MLEGLCGCAVIMLAITGQVQVGLDKRVTEGKGESIEVWDIVYTLVSRG
jgi:hypothetical protein